MKRIKIREVELKEKEGKIAVALVANDFEELLQQLEAITFADVDVIEWRIDHFKAFLNDDMVLKALQMIRNYVKEKVVIATFRTLWEGGASAITKENYVHLLKLVVASKLIDIIDLELFAQKNDVLNEIIAFAHQNNVYVIMSNHEFERTIAYNDLIKRYEMMLEYDVDFLKMAMMPKDEMDVIDLIKATAYMNKQCTKLMITMAMGDLGKASRVCCCLSGSCISFGCIDHASAPGQIAVNQLKNILSLFS